MRMMKLLCLLPMTVLTAGDANPGGQLAGFEDLFKLAMGRSNSHNSQQDRGDRSLANTYPFKLGEKTSSAAHIGRRRIPTSRISVSHEPAYSAHVQFGHDIDQALRQPAVTAARAPSATLGQSLFNQAPTGTNYQTQAGVPASSFHLNLQSQSQAQAGFTLLAGFGSRTNPTSQYQIGAPQNNYAFGNLATSQAAATAPSYSQAAAPVFAQVAAQAYTQAAVPAYSQAVAPAYSQGAAPAYSQAATPAYSQAAARIPIHSTPQFSNFPPAAPVAAYALHDQQVPSITVNEDIFIAADTPLAGGPGQCPAAPRLSALQCQGAVNSCWSVGVDDVDCPGHSLCCFDGCVNVCYGQARAVVRPAPSFVNPERRFNPAQRRRKPAGQTFEAVAAAGQRCIDKIEQVEEIEYDELEECHHSYDKKCHTSYSTEYESQQEEECDDNYKKSCDITYSPQAQNVTVKVCMMPLVKDCNLRGPEVCRTEYISECWTKNDPHIVEDDVPKCRTEYEEKCVETQSGYVTGQECRKWPREVCTVRKELKAKFNPVTKCDKVPQELCGPSGCGFVPGPEECHDQVKTVVTDIPNEICDLQPQRQCKHVTKLVPKLTPVEECVDVPKEVCQKKKGNPRTVLKPVTKKWCYTPSEESGLA